MTKAHLKRHGFYWLSLIIFASLGIFLFSLLSQDKRLQFVIILTITYIYIIWGILHHWFHHDLTAKIVVEYILMGSLGISIVFFFLKGGLGL